MLFYFISLIILFFTALLYIKIATYFNIIDNPNHRSSHSVPTIRGGGVLFFIAVLIFFFGSGFQYPYFVLAVSLLSIVSFVDDLITLSSKIRLPFQFIAMSFILLEMGFFENPMWLIVPLIVIGVGFINIYNFMDGINGITGLYSIVTLTSLFFINKENPLIEESLIVTVLISLIIFGFYNFRKKARFFAGDIGSISIAMVLFFIGFLLMIQLKAPVISLLILVYGIDATLTLVYRKIIGEHITQPHRHHLYQKLVDVLKWSHLKVAVFFGFIQLLVNLVVYKTYQLHLSIQFAIVTGIIFIFMILYYIIFKRLKRIGV